MNRHTALGAAFVVALLAASALVAAQFEGALDRVVPITVRASRAGLLMDRGAEVKVLGVTVGTVRTVAPTADGAELGVGLFPSMADKVPADVTAQVVPLTIFGAKYVELVRPAAPSPPIRAGAVIGGSRVAVEINETFEHLLGQLNAIEPSRFDLALSAVADALQGNGDRLGRLAVDLDGYLGKINPSLPALADDLAKAPPVLDTYAAVTPDVIRIGDNLGATGDTLAATQLGTFLLSLTKFGNQSAEFLGHIDQPLADALQISRPTAGLLADYSTMFPCLFQGLDLNRQLLSRDQDSGLHVDVAVGPGARPYRYPQDLPQIQPGTGPSCHGMVGRR
ncbi:MCE family protein [Kutzneria buriramensis]|uniref:Phospholipid/cholesterol/gamma-HCH transport system substrate-binding protein n=1 Tax=Kutzneria buriramensis TaxID=1045776 RepID=A0A3E0HA41_9PSEU|nr:MCE family protein [Kutzneria buriramensis]REH40924.1 phospholipid/cholesterol/gamma-HCH transport system substrate-binding protein [Kutzneria buriramensis]